MVAEWNAAHPNEKVKFQPVPEGQSSEEVVLAAIVGKTTPDIYSNMWQGDVEAYAKAKILVALDTLKGFKDFIYSRCDSSTIKEVTAADGHIYQVPWKVNPIMMIYNKKLLDGIGFKNPPTTYKEFFTAAERFQKQNLVNGRVTKWFGYAEILPTWWQRLFDFYPLYLAESGGMPLVKNNKAVFNNKYALRVFNFLRTLYVHDYFPKERLSARQDVFLSSVIATRFTGPWDIAHTEKFKPKGFKYDFAPLPTSGKKSELPITYCDPKNIVIFNTCKNPQAAWEFIKFYLSEKNELKFLEITNQLPRRKDLLSNPLFEDYFNKNPMMKKFARQTLHIKGIDQALYLKEVFDIISQAYEESVVYRVRTPKAALDDAEKQVNLLYSK